MKNILSIFLLVICILQSSTVLSEQNKLHNRTQSSFKLFIHHGYVGAPDFSGFGFEDSVIIYEHQFYSKNENHRKDFGSQKFLKIVDKINNSPGQYVMFDIENWFYKNIPSRENKKVINRFLDTVAKFKSKLPNRKFGFYGTVPAYLHPNAISNERLMKVFDKKNQERKAIVDAVDVLYPVLYMYPNNIDNWLKWSEHIKNSAENLVNEKPVIPFLYPKYHPISKSFKDGKVWLEPEVWRTQLEFVYENFDGLIIWIGAHGNQGQWSDNIPWWVETKKFLNEKGLLGK